MPRPMSEEEMERIREAIYSGRMIEAIKLYRQGSGEGLKEAKDFVEALAAELRRVSPERFTAPAGGQGCAGMVVILLLLLGAIVRMWA